MLRKIIGKIVETILPPPAKASTEEAQKPPADASAPKVKAISLEELLGGGELAKEPVEFYINTYGGSADDMFAMYDVMQRVMEETEIHTIGVGKVMSAGTLLLAAGTKGKRKIGKSCRVMIHNVAAGNFGTLPNLANELEAIQQLQDDYITAMVENTKFTRKKLEKLLNEKVNIYLSAEEAVKYGLADEIM